MGGFSCILLFIIASLCFGIDGGVTNSKDVSTMTLLKLQWRNSSQLRWEGVDPCASNWVGVTCSGSRVIYLHLTSMGLKGELPPEIGSLTALQSLDLSYNTGLTGQIPSSLGNLGRLFELLLIGCSLSGRIPAELGNLQRLKTLDLNTNKLGGTIPAELGNLSRLYWFDISSNNIRGTLPVELGKLGKAAHFHFNKNQLQGPIPPEIFHEKMSIIHVLFDQNNFSGMIPSTLGLVKTIQILKFDRNHLEGGIPSNISSLENLSDMRLSNNELKGQIPDLSVLSNLQYLDLSNNSFDASPVPQWISSLTLLTTIAIENGKLNGSLPSSVLKLPQLETLRMAGNFINGVVDLSGLTGQTLQLVDLEYNNITSFNPLNTPMDVNFFGNPVCADGSQQLKLKACHPEKAAIGTPYTTVTKDCGEATKCGENLKIDPVDCECAMPFEGYLIFRAPSFATLNIISRFQKLEKSLMNLTNLVGLTNSSVYIFCCMSFNMDDSLKIPIRIFPPVRMKYFGQAYVVNLIYSLSNQSYNPPTEFGPYYFIPTSYTHPDPSKGSSKVPVIGIAIGVPLAVLAILGMGIYIIILKRKAKRAAKNSRPFGSWGFASGECNGDAPKLKGARWFTFEELKQATNNFSTENEIGAGGYGKVYKGILAESRQMVAVKRAKAESLQGGGEFKTEIELLSRVHHKNLVGLIGFCSEEGEHMLVYEFMPNASLRDNLSGRTGITLDWRRRIQIALGAARGLTYLHDHANPAIIHRDVKSSNILLDENLNPKVADFGLSKLIADTGGRGHITSQVKGTMGYLDPEYYMTHQLTQKSDVYSFGVVLLEMLSARQPIERGKYLVREVKSASERGGRDILAELQLLDPVLRNSPISPSVLDCFVKLAVSCCEDEGACRPKMSEVVKELESMADKCGGNDIEREREMEDGEATFRKLGFHRLANSASASFDYSGSGGHIVPPIVEPK
ncbi:leucine-rich repeat receptor protein kinase HPCA1 [Cryptomeria japonica]|uniref:leucine-rich repeat receptor protein kinase HPCA1 n=1 Tax=Cryptomeria japonica TaxID=3369 RepID=UPI0027D9E71E|nr:leucine-rich repeat receptor protein kinase HPCA1 [Cryptomeria japonica]